MTSSSSPTISDSTVRNISNDKAEELLLEAKTSGEDNVCTTWYRHVSRLGPLRWCHTKAVRHTYLEEEDIV